MCMYSGEMKRGKDSVVMREERRGYHRCVSKCTFYNFLLVRVGKYDPSEVYIAKLAKSGRD